MVDHRGMDTDPPSQMPPGAVPAPKTGLEPHGPREPARMQLIRRIVTSTACGVCGDPTGIRCCEFGRDR